jgi:hypothetical protein
MLLMAKGRPKVATTPLRNATPEECKSIAQGVVANYGTWSLDEATKTATLKVERAFFPNTEGYAIKGTIDLNGDVLKTKGPILATPSGIDPDNQSS